VAYVLPDKMLLVPYFCFMSVAECGKGMVSLRASAGDGSDAGWLFSSTCPQRCSHEFGPQSIPSKHPLPQREYRIEDLRKNWSINAPGKARSLTKSEILLPRRGNLTLLWRSDW